MVADTAMCPSCFGCGGWGDSDSYSSCASCSETGVVTLDRGQQLVRTYVVARALERRRVEWISTDATSRRQWIEAEQPRRTESSLRQFRPIPLIPKSVMQWARRPRLQADVLRRLEQEWRDTHTEPDWERLPDEEVLVRRFLDRYGRQCELYKKYRQDKKDYDTRVQAFQENLQRSKAAVRRVRRGVDSVIFALLLILVLITGVWRSHPVVTIVAGLFALWIRRIVLLNPDEYEFYEVERKWNIANHWPTWSNNEEVNWSIPEEYSQKRRAWLEWHRNIPSQIESRDAWLKTHPEPEKPSDYR